ncbi:sodium/proton antiporter NhaB [Kangiella sp. TOML190]|uniref:sodium/proton antiporter NhaB n=1 Tax=Kangiella sp. TOML190 TaxID=2931351 RepID=UPI0020415FB6|nr:sodium/proton antiporter NhaB [Kangiella sp. TOML190]
MSYSARKAIFDNFLGNAPHWYKTTIVAFLLINPLILWSLGPVIAGWVLVGQFIFTLAMALKCYPLQPGGLLAFEAVLLGLTSTDTIMYEIQSNLEVLLLLIFMVAGIFFMKNLLLFLFSRILLGIKSKRTLSLMFLLVAAFLSAFLDALTVTAVVISVGVGFYGIYHKVAAGIDYKERDDITTDEEVYEQHRADLSQFRSFLRSLMMHAAIGTALGGVCTLVGEPQNLLIANTANWEFGEFFLRMAPVTIPVLFAGVLVCLFLETTKIMGYGATLPDAVRKVMEDDQAEREAKRTKKDNWNLAMQALVGVWLIIALAFHLSTVGLIGLSVIVLASAFTGVIDEHAIGKSFEEALPFTALLTVFFVIVGVIFDQELFKPIIEYIFTLDRDSQVAAFYLANGALSAISDNVFVATVYVGEIKQAAINGVIDRDAFDLLSVAINTGTNIPSVATPNGQAAFLFLLTSGLAPLIRLSYMRMVIMALPYTIVMTIVGLIAVVYFLKPATATMYEKQLINHHTVEQLKSDGKSKGH